MKYKSKKSSIILGDPLPVWFDIGLNVRPACLHVVVCCETIAKLMSWKLIVNCTTWHNIHPDHDYWDLNKKFNVEADSWMSVLLGNQQPIQNQCCRSLLLQLFWIPVVPHLVPVFSLTPCLPWPPYLSFLSPQKPPVYPDNSHCNKLFKCSIYVSNYLSTAFITGWILKKDK